MVADLAHPATIAYLDLAGSRRLAAWLARERLRVCEASGDLVLCLPRERDTLEWLRPEAPPAGSVPVAFAEGFAWCGGRLADPSAQPWPTLEVDLWWRRDTAVTVPVLSRFVISAPDGRVVYDQARLVGRGLSVLADWPAGVPYLERFPLPLPVGLVPGRYRVTMAVGVRRDRMTFPAESSDPRWRASRGLTSLGTFEWPPRSSP
jgi:hypothetical protein